MSQASELNRVIFAAGAGCARLRRTNPAAGEPRDSEVSGSAHEGFVITEVEDLNDIPEYGENSMSPLEKQAVSIGTQTACHGGF